jgi:hypothetical protein
LTTAASCRKWRQEQAQGVPSICSGRAVPDHNSAAHSSAHRPPPPRPLLTRRKMQQSLQLNVLQVEHRAEERFEQLREQRLEQPLEQRVEQRRIEVKVEVEVQVEMERKTQLMMQASTRPAILLPVLPDEQRAVLRGTQPRLRAKGPELTMRDARPRVLKPSR